VKAVVVRQPWATLIALGVKTIETRPAPPNGPMRPEGVRGLPGCSLERGERIAIVAGVATPYCVGDWLVNHSDPPWMAQHARSNPIRHPLPIGAVVCTVTVDDALPIVGVTRAPAPHAITRCTWDGAGVLVRYEYEDVLDLGMTVERYDPQLPLGDFTPGRWGWLLSDPQPCGAGAGPSGYTAERCPKCGWLMVHHGEGGLRCPSPIPCKGKQGVFTLPNDVAAQIGADRRGER
jgi:hypothetical protein